MRLLFSAFFLFQMGIAFVGSSQTCDTVDAANQSKVEKAANRYKEQVTHGKDAKLNSSEGFEIAQYLRRQEDQTFSPGLYKAVIIQLKTEYGKEKKAAAKAEIIYRIGI